MNKALSLILNFGLFLFAVLPVFSSTAGLYSEGEYTVDEAGSFNYSLPIDVPVGRGMIQPSLSVNYNSNGGDGLLGKGWSLGGLSSIHRCAPVTAKDGFIAPVNFGIQDRFCLDGERLIPTYFSDEYVVFAMENFSYTKIIGYGHSNSDSPITGHKLYNDFSYFKIWDTNGTVSEYGNSVDSKIEANLDTSYDPFLAFLYPPGTPPLLSWAINKIQDINGNYMEIDYIENNATGEYYPSEIKYAKTTSTDFFAHVKFYYGERSKNGPVSYTSGSKMQLTKQLNSIHTEVLTAEPSNPWRTHKEYNFSYDDTFASSLHLSEIQECSWEIGRRACLPPLSFTYSVYDLPVQYQEKEWSSPFIDFSASNYSGILAGVIDMNGDGLPDIFNAQNGSLYTGSGSGFSFIPTTWTVPVGYHTITTSVNFGDGIIEQISNLFDFNGDGLPDYFCSSTGLVWLNTGSGFETTPRNSWVISGQQPFQFVKNGTNVRQIAGFMDLNRDGLIDFYKQGGPLYLNNGHGFYTPDGTFNPVYHILERDTQGKTFSGFIDMNGDGYSDFFSGTSSSGEIHLSTGVSWKGQSDSWNRSDSGQLYISYFDTNSGRSDGLMDFNGDGLPDFYEVSTGKVHINNGSGFQSELRYDDVHEGINIPMTWRENNNGVYSTFAGWMDLNGDGFPDFYNAKTHTAYIAVPENQRLTAIHNGNHDIIIAYSDLSNDQVYSPSLPPEYPNKPVQSMIVVNLIFDDDGIGGYTENSYKYVGAQTHQDYGFLGFNMIQQKDHNRNRIKQTFYRQDYPYIGRVSKEKTYLNDICMEENLYEWDYEDVGTYYWRFGNWYPPLPGHVMKIIWVKPVSANFNNRIETSSLWLERHLSRSWNAARHLETVEEEQYDQTIETVYLYETDDICSESDNCSNISGRVQREIKTFTVGAESITRTNEYSYNSRGLLIQEKREPYASDALSLKLTTDHEYDIWGNKTSSCASASDIDTRCSFYQYSSVTHYRLPDWSGAGADINNLKTKISYQYDSLTGKIVSQKDEKNNLQTNFDYDIFGRLKRTDNPDGTFSTVFHEHKEAIDYFYPEFCPPNDYRWGSIHNSSDFPGVKGLNYYDMKGRVVRTVSRLPLKVPADYIIQDTEYDAQGRLYRKSRPYLPGETPNWFIYAYDGMDRPVAVTDPLGRITTTEYGVSFSGPPFWVKVTDARSYSSWTYKNPLGQIAKTKDAMGSEITFTYWPDGSQKTATDPNGNIITYYYDLLGRKISQDDPTTGTWTYKYNSASELVEQQDNKGNITNMAYDILGRLTSSTTSEGSALFYYDEIDGRSAYGKLLCTEGPGKFHQAYTEDLYYDSLLRMSQKKIKIGDEEEQIFSYSHDSLGRLDTVTYPSGFAVKYEYADGILKKVYRANDPTLVYWQAQELNADGAVIDEVRSNGVNVTQQTDLLGRPYLLQKNNSLWQTYVYDEVGNVTARYNGLPGAPLEEFAYDQLNRLINRSVDSLSLSDTYSYVQNQGGNLGNLTGKPDLGELYYGGSSGTATIPPHAINYVITTAGTHYFDYDANGNVTAYFDRSLYWNAENRLSFIRDQNSASAFFYSPTGAMLKKTGFAYQGGSFEGRGAINREKVSETLYVDGLYEINKENGNTARKHLIKAGNNSVAVYTETTGTNPSTNLRYLYYDHLGSLDSITNESGTIIHTASFDAWGRERNPYYFVTPFNPDNQYLNIPETDITDLGYTGHRQVGNFGLVHMRGRVYDPLLGRFLSPDPIIQDPLDLQTYNRYAYVRNNPLIYIDPSGYGFKEFMKAIFAPLLGIALSGGMHFLAAGFISGGVGAIINKGNILKGAVTGAFSAAAFNWAGHGAHNIRPIQAHFIAGAASSGFSASLYGGNMGRAALTGGVSGALGVSVTLNNRFKNLTPGKFHMGQFSATVAAGGIGSYLSGGSFGDGAYTAAMGYTFNHLMELKGIRQVEDLLEHGDGAYLLTRPLSSNYMHSALIVVKNGQIEVLSFGPAATGPKKYGWLRKRGGYAAIDNVSKFIVDKITDFKSDGTSILSFEAKDTAPTYFFLYNNCSDKVGSYLNKHGEMNVGGIMTTPWSLRNSIKNHGVLQNRTVHDSGLNYNYYDKATSGLHYYR